ncbi:MAG: hypothetical protein GWO02_12015, partial [Gammaproteobacteria bacterium]|nr:hypothetical protein [Gammaproteobacteria bacterium]
RTDIRAVEAIAWSWRRAGIGAACGFGLGLLFSIGLVVVYEPGFESEAKRKLWTYPVLLPICYAFVGGLIGGLATKTLETKT